MAIKLIAIDIDGTLINSKREITPRVKAALNAASAQGVYVVLCTGRPYPGVEGLLQELDLVKRPRLCRNLQRNFGATNRFEKSTRAFLNDS